MTFVFSQGQKLYDRVSSNARILNSLLRSSHSLLIALTILSFITGFLGVAILSVISKAAVQAGASPPTSMLIFMFLSVTMLCAQHVHRYLAAIVATRIENQLRTELASLILDCSLRSLEQRRHTSILTIVTHDVAALSAIMLNLPTIISNLVLLIGAFVYLMTLSGYWIVIYVYPVVILSVLIYVLVLSKIQPVYDHVWHAYSQVMGHFEDLVAGIKEFKLDTNMRLRFLVNHLKVTTDQLAACHLLATSKHSTAMHLGQGLLYVVIGLAVFVYPSLVATSSEVVTSLVLFLLYIVGPLDALVNAYPLFAKASTSLAKIAEFDRELSRSQESPQQTNTISKPAVCFRSVNLIEVSFVYRCNHKGVNRIGPFSLNIRRGELIFVVGKNGSGKTTLVKLLCALYSPAEGEIALDGTVVTGGSVCTYRELFSVVFSDFHLPEKVCDLYEFNTVFGKSLMPAFGLDAVLHHPTEFRVKELSQGQRRRLAIFLAATSLRPIHIFDEPGSDLDPQFKEYFYEVLLDELRRQGKTVVVVSNDHRWFRQADQLITLNEGKMVTADIDHFGIGG